MLKMNNSLILILFTFVGSLSLASFSLKESELIIAQPIDAVYIQPYNGNLKSYMDAVAKSESNGRIDIVNEIGMLGKYQFSPRTLKALGIDVSKEDFLLNEYLQDSAMVLNLIRNDSILKNVIEEFDGTWKDGIYLTKSGILAGAHLVGPYGVLTYFYPEEYNHIIQDSKGVHVTRYMEKFGNYKLNLKKR